MEWRREDGRWYGHSFRRDFHGKPSLEEAVDDGYRQARSDGYDGWLKVDEIWVKGENPISEYRVVMSPGS